MTGPGTLAPAAVPVLAPAEAVAVAAELAGGFARDAADRDARRILPFAELDRLSDAGLLAITVPARYGGADLPVATVVEVIRLLSAGDPNIGQIPHSHFVYVNQLRLQGTDDQQRRLFAEVLAGRRFGNAQSEAGTKHVRDIRTTLTADAPGQLAAHRAQVLRHRRPAGPPDPGARPPRVPTVRSSSHGWTGTPPASTSSTTGTAWASGPPPAVPCMLRDVAVPDDLITPFAVTFDGPQTYGAYAQVLHAAIDAGIARAALTDAAAFVREKSRPYPDAKVERAADDPLVTQAFGEIELAVRASEALLAEAARAIDRAGPDPTAESATAASLAVAAARAATTHAALEASGRLFEVAGTRSAAGGLGLDRHWRNARTHTLHDPAAWKVQHLGRWAVDGAPPPNHGQV